MLIIRLFKLEAFLYILNTQMVNNASTIPLKALNLLSFWMACSK
jgi:hypothetical protein